MPIKMTETNSFFIKNLTAFANYFCKKLPPSALRIVWTTGEEEFLLFNAPVQFSYGYYIGKFKFLLTAINLPITHLLI